jgi:superfamily II DNA helicase RecQ
MNIITTMKQLRTHDSHISKPTQLICKDHKFVSHVKRIAVDEAHSIYTAGILKHNKLAHHPAYSYFNTIWPLFPRSTTVIALSATLLKHILKTVQHKLSHSPDHLFIHLSSNWPNVMYAMQPIIGSLHDFANPSFLIPKFPSTNANPTNTCLL